MKIYTNESLPPREMVAHALSVDEEKEKITSFCNKMQKKYRNWHIQLYMSFFFCIFALAFPNEQNGKRINRKKYHVRHHY